MVATNHQLKLLIQKFKEENVYNVIFFVVNVMAQALANAKHA